MVVTKITRGRVSFLCKAYVLHNGLNIRPLVHGEPVFIGHNDRIGDVVIITVNNRVSFIAPKYIAESMVENE